MRIPLARYAVRELLLLGGLALAAMVASAVWFWYAAPVFAVALVFILAFFRDPERRAPAGPGLVVAPADGTVIEVAEVEEPRLLATRTHKIGIFMSLASVHVNRSPCAGCVEAVQHRPGRFLDARVPESSAENESNDILLADVEGRPARLLVRQIAGVLARRIVCAVAPGQTLARGQRIGMVKFGSRAEVYVPVASRFEVAVAPGQRVKAGVTVLGRFP